MTTSPVDDIKYVLAALAHFGPRGATLPELETMHGATYEPTSPLGQALAAAVEQGNVEQHDDRYRVAVPADRPVKLLPTHVDTTVLDIVGTHIPGEDLAQLDALQALIADLQAYGRALLAGALDAYQPIADADGNLLFVHRLCSWQEWGHRNRPPIRCRRCEQRTEAWAPVYCRSNVTIHNDRSPVLPNDPALIGALRGAFGDVELGDVRSDLGEPETPAGRRFAGILDDTIGGM